MQETLDPVTFDLSAVSQADYRTGSRGFRIAFTLSFALVAIVATIAVVTRPGVLRDPVSVFILVTVIVVWGSCAACINVVLSQGAIRLEVRANGISLTYRDGRVKRLRWDSDRTRVTLWRNELALRGGRPFPFSLFDLRTFYPVDNPLTAEAFEAIVSSARAAGLGPVVSVVRDSQPRTVFVFRGRPGLLAEKAEQRIA